ncbi:unnamed protein product [Angiostrongylus costaricensis]|uniref:CHZ domain-containing protein n=1 Tax=Angiostrongylus costaricensis TaxID=334426 RepID=A0A0R3PRG7_ANGCS|nr:unnamed protein product [Angiostrongylus costaricensis]
MADVQKALPNSSGNGSDPTENKTVDDDEVVVDLGSNYDDAGKTVEHPIETHVGEEDTQEEGEEQTPEVNGGNHSNDRSANEGGEALESPASLDQIGEVSYGN